MATKTLILVRHGQYLVDRDAEGKRIPTSERLTTLGRKQAKLAGRRLRENKIDRIIHSSMPRAIETASIIKEQLAYRGKSSQCHHLRECVPGFPKKLRKRYGHTNVKNLNADKAQVERAFKKYFKPSRKDSVEVLVCHGNVIRYLVCRAMGIDTESWMSMDILQCGISVIRLKSKGDHRSIVLSHNDIGHIPMKDRTFI